MFFFLFLFFILGSAVGSFLNVVIDRAVQGQSILGRSYCDHCKATLSTVDLIPIISFVGLGARCRYCRKPISWQYPLVELVTALLFSLTFYTLASGDKLGLITLPYYLLVLSILVIVAVVDIKFSLIPTAFVYAGALAALFYNYFYFSSADFVLAVLAAFALAIFFGAIHLITGGRGMGSGDIPLVFLMGLFLGWPNAIAGLFSAFSIGAVVSLILVILGRKRFGQTIPFGPFLVLGTILALFWGKQLVAWYLGLL